MNIKFRHVGLVVKDLNKSISFWCKDLGFKKLKKKKEKGKTIDQILGFKNTYVETIKLTNGKNIIMELLYFKKPKTKKNRTIKTNSQGFTHVALTVSNLDKLYKKLKKKISFNCPPQISSNGKVKLTYAKCFDGVYIEFVQNLKK